MEGRTGSRRGRSRPARAQRLLELAQPLLRERPEARELRHERRALEVPRKLRLFEEPAHPHVPPPRYHAPGVPPRRARHERRARPRKVDALELRLQRRPRRRRQPQRLQVFKQRRAKVRLPPARPRRARRGRHGGEVLPPEALRLVIAVYEDEVGGVHNDAHTGRVRDHKRLGVVCAIVLQPGLVHSDLHASCASLRRRSRDPSLNPWCSTCSPLWRFQAPGWHAARARTLAISSRGAVAICIWK